MTTKLPKLPIILYEESEDGKTQSSIPYIEVRQDEVMPPVLFLFEYKDSGETEPDSNGEEVIIVDQIPHQYVDMKYIQDKTSPKLFDELRVALGMKSLKEAQKMGKEIIDKVLENQKKEKQEN